MLFAAIVFVAGLSAFIGYRAARQQASGIPSVPGIIQPQGSTPLPEQPAAVSHIVFIRGNNVWLRGGGEDQQVTSDGTPDDPKNGLPSVYYRNPVLSPDGRTVAVIRSTRNNTETRALRIIPLLSPGSVQTLSESVEWSMDSVRWNHDGTGIYFVSGTTGAYDTKKLDLVTLSNKTVTELGTFTVQSGCGGGSSDPSDHLTWAENINGWPVTFTLSSDGSYIVHNTSCTGHGLAYFDLTTKKDVPLDDKNVGAVFAANGKTFASYTASTISVYDSATKKLQHKYDTLGQVSALLYGPDGQTIYYTTSKETKSYTLDGDEALQVMGFSPLEIRENQTTLYGLDTTSGISSVIAAFDAHAARPFSTNTQGNVVSLALVENATGFYDAVQASKPANAIQAAKPIVKLVSINTDTSVVTPIVSNAQQAMQ